MSSLARFELLKNFNAPCADLTTMAERELSAFFNAITNCSGQEQAELSSRRLVAGVDRDR